MNVIIDPSIETTVESLVEGCVLTDFFDVVTYNRMLLVNDVKREEEHVTLHLEDVHPSQDCRFVVEIARGTMVRAICNPNMAVPA